MLFTLTKRLDALRDSLSLNVGDRSYRERTALQYVCAAFDEGNFMLALNNLLSAYLIAHTERKDAIQKVEILEVAAHDSQF